MTTGTPNFFLVGAAKAGTTTLHRILSAHPQIYMSPIKEPNYFSQPDMRKNFYIKNYRSSISLDIEKYLSGPMKRNIQIADIQNWSDYIRLFRDVSGETAIGEASNSYLYCPSAPREISKRLPNAKILAILRNPIDRTWSHYLMNRRLGYTLSTDFVTEFRQDSCQKLKGWGITHNYHDLGMYSSQLRRYYSTFPADQVKIILFDDYCKSPDTILEGVFDFLGVDATVGIDFSRKENQAALPRFRILNYLLFRSGMIHKVKRLSHPAIVSLAEKLFFTSSSLPKLSHLERQFLRDIYCEDIDKVADLLQRDLTVWIEK